MDCSPPGSSVCGIFQARILEWVAVSFSRGYSQPRDQTQDFHITGRFFTVWATRESESESHSVASDSLWSHGLWNSPSQNTGVGSLSLLQRIFPTQGSNPGLPHCRRILYQLSHKGSPIKKINCDYFFTIRKGMFRKKSAKNYYFGKTTLEPKRFLLEISVESLPIAH